MGSDKRHGATWCSLKGITDADPLPLQVPTNDLVVVDRKLLLGMGFLMVRLEGKSTNPRSISSEGLRHRLRVRCSAELQGYGNGAGRVHGGLLVQQARIFIHLAVRAWPLCCCRSRFEGVAPLLSLTMTPLMGRGLLCMQAWVTTFRACVEDAALVPLGGLGFLSSRSDGLRQDKGP